MIEQTQDAALLATFFGRDAGRYVYQLGDLDPFFFPATRWWVTRPAEVTFTRLSALCFIHAEGCAAALGVGDRHGSSVEIERGCCG